MLRLPVALLVVPALAGCVSSAGDPLEPRDSAALRRELSRARTAAIAGDRRAAADALRAFRIRVVKLRQAERLEPTLADQLGEGARQAETRVALEVAAPATGAPPAGKAGGKPPPGKGNGKGRRGKEDEDD